MSTNTTIYYTFTDEAPMLATASFLPVIKAFTKDAGINFELKNISLATRILSTFPSYLKDEQRVSNALNELGELTQNPNANIIKLPNISASVPQLKAAISELQSKGFKIPNFPENPSSNEENEINKTYSQILGSAVNPVLREGNSDRRVAGAVKEYAERNPHSMGAWSKDSRTHVAHMTENDFYGTELSYISDRDQTVKIVLEKNDGSQEMLKELNILNKEIIDGSMISIKALRTFYKTQFLEAKDQNILLSLHLKATMMKVSDPVMFGHAVEVYFEDVFNKHSEIFNSIGVITQNGLGDIYAKITTLDKSLQKEIKNDIDNCIKQNSALAMVNSDKGITNLHVPSDVIIDASMPAMIRNSGMMWGEDGKAYDTKAIIPDRCYAGIYQEAIQFCKENGAFDPKTMGDVSNVGLMAKKAEEYGSHDKTFILSDNGIVKVLTDDNKILMEHKVEKGDIWRMCQTKDVSIKDWVALAVRRANNTKYPTVFWLDDKRAHDRNIILKVETYLKDHDTNNLNIKIMSPKVACAYSLKLVKEGKNAISVTGNVLRDYLTDLFPILELGTSAKMLSIVPLLAGGGLYETGAGGSAPKHIQQLINENHLRWDSLGEFLALAISLEELADKTKNNKIKLIATTLNEANSLYLKNDNSPSRKVKENDNRSSHYYVAKYWATALASQSEDLDLKEKFKDISARLNSGENNILSELLGVQGKKVDIGGYYYPDMKKLNSIMRPSETFNNIVDSI